MESKQNQLRLKAWHFGFILLSFFILTNIIGTISLNAMPAAGDNSSLMDLDGVDDVNDEIDFILFYDDGAENCKKMEYNLDQLAQGNQASNVGFFKINVNEYPDVALRYNVSGVPCTLILSEGKESKRIMGIVSQSNLEMILDRISN